MSFFLQTFNIFVDAFTLILMIRVIMSWLVLEHRSTIGSFVWDCTEPVLEPIRNLLPSMRIDFSPILLIWLIRMLQNWINTHL